MIDAAAPAAVLVVTAEAIGPMVLRNGRCGFDERRSLGEIGDAIMLRPGSSDVRRGAERGSDKQRDGQNKAEGHRGFERNAHFNLLSSKRRLYAEQLYFCSFTIFGDRRLRCDRLAQETSIEGDLFQALQKILLLLQFHRPKLAGDDATDL
jgi:hypothetical protein